MSQSDSQTPLPEDDLPPDARNVIKKARRSFGVSIAILLFGLIAVAGAVVYRVNRDDGGPASRYSAGTVQLPAGADLVSASTAEGLITLTYTLDGKTIIHVVDGKTGETVNDIAVTTK